jgi:carbon monoxide dehydrogenase subunit G
VATRIQSEARQSLLVQVESEVAIACDADHAFAQLRDFRSLCGYVPGASLTRAVDHQTIEARMQVGVKPFLVVMAGTAHMVSSNRRAREARLVVVGGAPPDSGDVRAVISVSVKPEGRGCRLRTAVQLALSGRSRFLGHNLVQRVAREAVARTGERFKKRLERVAAAEG